MSDESMKFVLPVVPGGRPRLLDQVREMIRRKYYSRRTEEAYVHWIKRHSSRESGRAKEREMDKKFLRARGREMEKDGTQVRA